MLTLGAKLHVALVDLGLWVDPRLASGDPAGRSARPWLGFLVVALLVAGLVLVGQGIGYVVERAVPHREQQP